MRKEEISAETSARLERLNARIAANADDEAALIERGRLRWALGMRGAAISDYLLAQKLNPSGKATQLLKATYEILDYYNKDLYNP